MAPLTSLLFLALLVSSGSSFAQQVETRGVAGKVGLESIVSGYLTELNGKYKLRVTEVRLEPDAYIGEHHHAVPGIRYVVSGEITVVEKGHTMVYKAGQYYYESGMDTHSAYNKAGAPTLILQFEIFPADHQGGSLIAPKT